MMTTEQDALIVQLRAEIALLEKGLKVIEWSRCDNPHWLKNQASNALNDVDDLRNPPTEKE
jgi:hypothetical protein